MKKSGLFLSSLLVLTGVGVLASCSGGSTQQTTSNISITILGPTEVEIGSTITLSVQIVNDSERLGFSLTSSDPSVATVDSDAKVTGIKAGSVTITAESRKDSSVKTTWNITVIESTIPTLSVSSSSATIVLGDNATTTFTANLSNPSNLPVRYEWSNEYSYMGTFVGNGEAAQMYRSFKAGTDIVTCKAYVGPYCLVASCDIYTKNIISEENTLWNKLSTKQDVITMINTSNNTKNYYLANDIDLEGEVINLTKTANYSNLKFSGILDGRGHTIKNYVVEGSTSNKSGGGLFGSITSKGQVLNLGIECEIGANGSGWGTGGFANTCYGLIQNCSFTVNHSYDTGKDADSSGWIPFCGAVYGCGSATIKDCVVNIADTDGRATIYADVAYPAGGQDFEHPQNFEVKNFYTNTSVVGGQAWDYGYAILDMSGYKTGINFASTEASYYKLNTTIWNLTDNAIPTLVTQ